MSRIDEAERRALALVQEAENRIRNELDRARGAIISAAHLARRGAPANPALAIATARELLTAACGSSAAVEELACLIQGGVSAPTGGYSRHLNAGIGGNAEKEWGPRRGAVAPLRGFGGAQ